MPNPAQHEAAPDDVIKLPNAFNLDDEFDELQLECPGCGVDLSRDAVFGAYGICSACRRHFWITGRERLNLLLDRDSFRESNSLVVSLDPLIFRDASLSHESTSGGTSATRLSDAVVTGIGGIGGRDSVIILVDFAHHGNAIGVVAGEKIALAFEQAISRRLPVIAICSAGPAKGPDTALSLMQGAKIANLVNRLRRGSLPFISLLTHPTTGPVYSGFANLADFVLAEPGALIGADSGRDVPSQRKHQTAEELLVAGMIDDVIDRTTQRDRFVALLELLEARGVPRPVSSPSSSVGPLLRPNEIARIAFRPDRPAPRYYIRSLMPVFLEIHGDRVAGEDSSLITGFGQLDGVSMAVIATDTPESSAAVGLGPIACRKAIKLIRLAARFDLPVLILIGNVSSPVEQDVQTRSGMGLSQLLSAITAAPVPVITVVTGVAAGDAVMAFNCGDRLLMQEFAVLLPGRTSVAAIAGGEQSISAPIGMLTARDCDVIGLTHAVITEPVGGAHQDLSGAAMQLRLALLHQLSILSNMGTRRLLEERTRQSRSIGVSTAAGAEAARVEIAQLQEIQRTLERSLGDLRARLDQRQLSLPAIPQLPHVSGLPHLPARPGRPALRRPTVTRQEITGLADRLAATGRELADKMSDAAARASQSDPRD